MIKNFEFLPGGTYIYYYFICKRKLWFYANRITMEHESDLVKIGKYIELFYKEENKYEKNVIIENIAPDVIKRLKDYILVLEIKKSSLFKEAAIWQLKYYLWYLKNKGLNVKGKLIIPEYNKEKYIELSKIDIIYLKNILKDIKKILSKNRPPKPIRKNYCKSCAYYLLCWDLY